MKYGKIGITAILFIVIAALIAYIVIISNTSLLQIPINFYLKRYNIASKFEKLKVNSPKSIEINGFLIKKNGIDFYADKLTLSVNGKGRVSFKLQNPRITIIQADAKENTKNSVKIPFKIGRADIENLTLKIFNKDGKIMDANGVNIRIEKNRIEANGKFSYKTKTASMNADIKLLKAKFRIYESGLVFTSITLNPVYIKAKLKGYSIDTEKPVNIKGLEVTLAPFGIKFIGFTGNLKFTNNEFTTKSDIKANFSYNNGSELSANISNIQSQNNILEGGSINIKATVKKKPKIRLKFDNISVNLKNLTTQDLCGQISINGENIDGKLFEGEAVILNRWYVNFADNGLILSFKDKLPYNLNISLNELFKADISVDDNRVASFYLYSSNLRKLFKRFVQDAYDYDFLNKVKIKDGNIKSEGKYKIKKGGFFVNIDADLKKASYNDRYTFKNISFKIPIIYNFKEKAKGFLNIKSVNIKEMRLALKLNILSSDGKIILNVRALKNKNLKIEPFKIDLNLKSRVFKTFLYFRLKMHNLAIIGRLKRIAIKGGRLKAFGNIYVNAFNGTINVHNISISGLFNMPVLSADVDFKHINLEDITKNTNFGLVKGYVEGYIRNLSLVNFTKPLSFKMLVKTQDVKGTSKRITLKAVNSISKIGGGYVKIAIPFFKSFPYSKIGMYASLKNNRFEMHGLYRNGNIEYIIKKGFLIGINVINMNKNNSISWDDMIERIKRVLNSNDVKIK